MDKNQNINESPKQPSATAQSNNSNDHSPETQNLVKFPIMDSYEHKIAIDIILKIATRTFSRTFMKNLTFTYISKLKEDKEQVRTVYITSTQQNTQTVDWPYRQLFYKRNKSYEDHEMLDFVHLCATMIQSNFKAYITAKRHKIANKKYKKVRNSLITFARIWKSKRIYNCKRCHEIKLNFRQTQRQIDEEYDKPKLDNKKLQLLNQYLQFNASMFRDTYQKLYSNGMWVLEENMKPMLRKKKYVHQEPSYNNYVKESQQREPKIKKQKRKREFEKKQYSKEEENEYMSFNSIPSNMQQSKLEERPIVAKGQYVYNEEQIQKSEQFAKEEQLQKESRQEAKEDIKKVGNPQKTVQMEKLKKRQKYDPRKAIQEGKKKKKTTDNNESVKVEEEKKVSVKAQVKDSSGKKVEKTPKKKKIVLSKNEKEGHKKVQSQVDCWVNTKKQSDKEWVKQIKQKLTKQMEEQKEEQQYQQKQKRIVHKQTNDNKKYQYIKNKQQIEALEREQVQEQVRRNQSKVQLKNEVREMVERTNMNKRKQMYRPVQELQQTYNKHYGDRYQNLMPKLGLLSVARGTQHDSNIPVVDSYSQNFNSQLKDILVHAKFWQIATRMQKTFKQFIIE